jgi:two-component sensor histidine kinase
VAVELRDEGDTFVVCVTDDGVGLSDQAGPSLGLEIVQTLVTEDLKGSFELAAGEQGTQALIRVPWPNGTGVD